MSRQYRDAPWRGFSLVELLVVIALVGVLVALLLPAIQAARESARRSTCQSRLRQVGIGLLNHEQAARRLPIGANHAQFASFGVSWWVGLLPYLEQEELYSQLDRVSMHHGFVPMNGKNGQLINRLELETLWCPSSPLPSQHPVGNILAMMPSYVGIAGAANIDGFSEQRVNQCCVPDTSGEISAGGMLIPNRSITLKEVVDGASNTIVVGEASDYVLSSTGARFRIDAGFPSGWIIGTSVVGVPPEYTVPRPAWNITTLRYAPNERRYNLNGINQDRGPNNPLVSAHPGGVAILLVDGSVHFLTDGIDLTVLARLATRDDGEKLLDAL